AAEDRHRRRVDPARAPGVWRLVTSPAEGPVGDAIADALCDEGFPVRPDRPVDDAREPRRAAVLDGVPQPPAEDRLDEIRSEGHGRAEGSRTGSGRRTIGDSEGSPGRVCGTGSLTGSMV